MHEHETVTPTRAAAGEEQRRAHAAIDIRALSKRYGARTAVDSLTLAIAPRCFTALLGPNGAGKSTLFQMLTGLFAADAGDALIAGHSISQQPVAALAALGVVFQQLSLDLDLSVERNLRFHAALHGLPRAIADERIAQGCAALGLAKDRQRSVRELSGGNRRKVELVRALLHRPAVLLMDEASVGLDPASRRDLLAALRADVAARDTSVLWATHLVEEAQQADRVLVLHQGKLIADGSPAEVTSALGAASLEAGFIQRTTRKEPAPA
jgi:ABC-2 type transport system ATP-binding protein